MIYNGIVQIENQVNKVDIKSRLDSAACTLSFDFTNQSTNNLIINLNNINEAATIKEIIYSNNNLLILGSFIINNLNYSFLSSHNCVYDTELIKIKWSVKTINPSSLIEIIKYNYNNNYTQGNFANGLSRSNIIDTVRGIKDTDTFKHFLIQTLKWGNYDAVVADRYKKPKCEKVIDSIPDIGNYKKIFEQFLENKEINISHIFNQFKRGPLKIDYLDTSYFTKFLYFYSYGKNIKHKMLISDKWSQYAWACLLIEENNVDTKLIKNLIGLNKEGKLTYKPISGKNYAKYNVYIDLISKNNEMKSDMFEELMFGWDKGDKKMEASINPRLHVEIKLNDWLQKN